MGGQDLLEGSELFLTTSQIPSIFKISRITPINKPQKPKEIMSSYRPLNNLPSLEKILEEYILINLNKHIKENNIINNNHHGGRKGYSTTSALININNEININSEQGKITAILATDLSAAFETVDHEILIKKLEFYGIRNNELKLLKSYLDNRKQYVEIDTFSSDIIDMPPCSVVQGGKMSGLLYTLYVNEIINVHKLINNKNYHNLKLNKKIQYKNITNKTINFVDDSSSVIGFKDQNQVKCYLTEYYNFLNIFYNANKLQLNNDKTKLLLNYKNKFKDIFKKIHFMAGNDKITPKNAIKILGVFIRSDLKLDTQIGKICANLHNRLYNLNKLKQFTSFQTRLVFIKSYIIGKLIYAMPTYMNISDKNIKSIHKIIMASARCAIGNYCYKKSIYYILNKCGIMNANDTIIYSSLKLYHSMYLKGEPKALLETFLKPNIRAKQRMFRPKYIPKTKHVENGFLYKGAQLYNKLPCELKVLNRERFATKLRSHLSSNVVWDTRD